MLTPLGLYRPPTSVTSHTSPTSSDRRWGFGSQIHHKSRSVSPTPPRGGGRGKTNLFRGYGSEIPSSAPPRCSTSIRARRVPGTRANGSHPVRLSLPGYLSYTVRGVSLILALCLGGLSRTALFVLRLTAERIALPLTDQRKSIRLLFGFRFTRARMVPLPG